jgi:hypothetical protein
MNVKQLELVFTSESRAPARPLVDTPLPVRTIARRYHLSIPMALAVCRANGIGGKEVM